MNHIESEKNIEELATADWTHFSIGRETRKILQKDEGLQEATNTFRLISQKSNKNMAILLPAVVIPSELTYRYQLPVIQDNFGTVVSVDYSNDSFSAPLFQAQLRDFFNSSPAQGKLITPIALCFSTCWIIDFLAHASDDQRKKIDKIVLLGALDSYTDLIPPETYGDDIKRKFVVMAKRSFGGDPLEKKAIQKSLNETNTDTIIQRYKAIGDVAPCREVEPFPDTEALLIWWERDFLQPDSRKVVENLFKKPTSDIVPGFHGWTATSAEQINTVMASFLQKS